MRPTTQQRTTSRHAGAVVTLILASTVLGVLIYGAYALYETLDALAGALS